MCDGGCRTQLGSLLLMSIDQQAKKKKPGFRPGVCVKNNKLYAFSEVRVVVVRRWPEMAAWTKTYSKPQWSRFRP